MNDTVEETPAPRFGKMNFKRSNRPKLAIDAVRRQGAITRLALETLGKDDAIAYLNAERAQIGGKPLDLATSTEDGYKSVERDLVAMRFDQTAIDKAGD